MPFTLRAVSDFGLREAECECDTLDEALHLAKSWREIGDMWPTEIVGVDGDVVLSEDELHKQLQLRKDELDEAHRWAG